MSEGSMVKWSFSGLKQFTTCPKQYYEVKVLQNYQIKETEQIRYGKEVHTALELYVKDKVPLAKNYLRFKPMVDALIAIPGDIHVELKMGLKSDGTSCEFDDPEYWVHGIADLLVVSDDTAYIIDYKTGSNKYPDPKQLKLMALMVFAKFPAVQLAKAGLLFVMHNTFISEEYERSKQDELWEAFAPDIARLEMSYNNNTWPATPMRLCGWCPVKSCKFNEVS
jgi:CRISPR/Cas system-associated exonuclease Cas4 (RecB family)